MYAILVNTRHSLKHIGEYFGGRDHTTVIHSKRTVRNLRDTDSEYKRTLIKFLQTI
jgi:chromosomal replication initiator protein